MIPTMEEAYEDFDELASLEKEEEEEEARTNRGHRALEDTYKLILEGMYQDALRHGGKKELYNSYYDQKEFFHELEKYMTQKYNKNNEDYFQ